MRGRKDLGDYQPSSSAKGGYAYMGEYYVPILQGKRLLRHKLQLCAISALKVLCVYGMGSANSPGFRQIYVMLPFLALVFFAGRGLISACSLFAWKDAMTKRQYQASEKPLAQGQRILPFLCAALILAEVIFLLLGGAIQGEWLVLLMAFLLTGLSLSARHVLALGAPVKQAQGKAPDTDVRLQAEMDEIGATQD